MFITTRIENIINGFGLEYSTKRQSHKYTSRNQDLTIFVAVTADLLIYTNDPLSPPAHAPTELGVP